MWNVLRPYLRCAKRVQLVEIIQRDLESSLVVFKKFSDSDVHSRNVK